MPLSCSKKNVIDESYCNNAKIIKTTCGGLVVQLLKSSTAGETWIDASSANKNTYDKCVLLRSLPGNNPNDGTIISINYVIVNKFDHGNFCEIGGLPSTKIELRELYTNCN
jgi:hypothetical protein